MMEVQTGVRCFEQVDGTSDSWSTLRTGGRTCALLLPVSQTLGEVLPIGGSEREPRPARAHRPRALTGSEELALSGHGGRGAGAAAGRTPTEKEREGEALPPSDQCRAAMSQAFKAFPGVQPPSRGLWAATHGHWAARTRQPLPKLLPALFHLPTALPLLSPPRPPPLTPVTHPAWRQQ